MSLHRLDKESWHQTTKHGKHFRSQRSKTTACSFRFFSRFDFKWFIAGKNTKCYLSLGSVHHHTLHDLTNHIASTYIYACNWSHRLGQQIAIQVSWLESYVSTVLCLLCRLRGPRQWLCQRCPCWISVWRKRSVKGSAVMLAPTWAVHCATGGERQWLQSKTFISRLRLPQTSPIYPLWPVEGTTGVVR